MCLPKDHGARVFILLHTQAGCKHPPKHQKPPLALLHHVNSLATGALVDDLAVDGAFDAVENDAVLGAGEDVVEEVGGEVHLLRG